MRARSTRTGACGCASTSPTPASASRAAQERLFQPCVQIDGAIAGQGGDAGLGLPIARKLAELMGGVIGCESVVGQGSLYWFTLRSEEARGGAAAGKAGEE